MPTAAFFRLLKVDFCCRGFLGGSGGGARGCSGSEDPCVLKRGLGCSPVVKLDSGNDSLVEIEASSSIGDTVIGFFFSWPGDADSSTRFRMLLRFGTGGDSPLLSLSWAADETAAAEVDEAEVDSAGP